MLWEPFIPCSQSQQGALNGAQTPRAAPPHAVLLSWAACGVPRAPHEHGPSQSLPCARPTKLRGGGSAGFSTSEMLRLTPRLHLASVNISPGRRQEPGGTGATASPSK